MDEKIFGNKTILLFLFVFCLFTIYVFDGFGKLFNPRSQSKISSISEYTQRELCFNFFQRDFISSYSIPNSRVAITIIVVKQDDYKNFMHAVNTTQCYAKHMGYQMHLINMTDDPKIEKLCNHTDIFFKRHCALAIFMKDHEDTIDYVLNIDADIGVINPCHRIQDYIDFTNKNIHIYFYERYYNQEIASGSYIVKNTQIGRNFLHFWADYFYRLPKSFHGTDNGAIHQVFMELHFTDEKLKMQCYNFWNSSKGFGDLFAYQSCTQHALMTKDSLFVNHTVKLIRKLQTGWVRDGWLTSNKWSPNDFMFHGWKKTKIGDEWEWPFENPIFDLKQCKYGNPSFSSFQHLSKYISTERVTKEILQKKVDKVKAEYWEHLQKLKILCKHNVEPIDGKCPLIN